MRLTQIKLAGFKSFVDPTAIATPGKLVGIVGPNGCGKSNVIDAVRWVLGESKASALRGESMQDVIFNGAGERKPVSRAAVELHFDNSQGRIAGQWGQYAEISIKRVLTRDGDSSYYINNIPVRRRDIHDLFLGTGLGPRAYAIIEQGMISRVIEAKPEELRVFLEEAAGVSKYKERRKETEGRLSDTRENLARVEDIRQELGQQLARLEGQAKVATEYRELEARHRQSQHLLWFARQQDAVRAREKCATELASLIVALEAAQAELRHAEAQLESRRTDHYSAGDALHERQAAFYAANAEVSRLEQQLTFARENESRIGAQMAQLTEGLDALATQEATLAEESRAADAALEAAIGAREQAALDEAEAQRGVPGAEAAVAEAAAVLADAQARIAQAEQAMRVAETRRESIERALDQLGTRRARLATELAALQPPAMDPELAVQQQLDEERTELAEREQAHTELQAVVQRLQEQQRERSAASQATGRALAELEARERALAALQARIGHGQGIDRWLAERHLDQAPRLFQVLDIEPGWEDALEAVMRERLEALELASLDAAIGWTAGDTRLPRRLSAYAPGDAQAGGADAAGDAPATAWLADAAGDARATARLPDAARVPTDPPLAADALLAKVRVKQPAVARFIADSLHGVRCSADLAGALAGRGTLREGEAFVTPQGHVVTAQGVALFAPDSELHGVLARQRELEELAGRIAEARRVAGEARSAQEALEQELRTRQTDYHQQGQALASQQRRVHDLEIEGVQLRKAAEAAAARRAQLAREQEEAVAAEDAERATLEALRRELADLQSRLHDEQAAREALRHARNEAEVALARSREHARAAERAAQEAGFAERRCRDRQAELARRAEALAAQSAQQRDLLAQLSSERQSIDWTPVEEALQRQLAARGAAEQALGVARDHLESLTAQLRAGDEARLAVEQRIEPLRAKMQDMQLKEQAAVLAEQQFAEQLAEAQADLVGLPDALKAFGSARGLPGEIERLAKAIAELGPVNLAAVDELTQATERKDYLDRQAADLTEAMDTLESAIRQIDRESRELLQQTFEVVNDNFSRLFPALFGGGQAKLLLTGEEILDSGVQVVAQPPGKRNTSIHLLSGGEKALTAISLVFALFQINPAPFCLLDEVDAPLDDPNTERFCKMVAQMSSSTQFLYISHNKITMEMANQLVGITMPEPGVSRVVAVDIAEALSLAEGAAVAAAAD